MIRRLLAVTALAGGLIAAHARADMLPPLSPEQATSLGHVLRLWSSGLIAGDLAADPGYTVTPADGHYDVSIPVAGPLGHVGAVVEGAPVSMKATPRDNGAWALDDVTLPSPLRLIAPADDKGKRLRIEQSFAEQTSNVLMDPTLAGPTSADTLRGGWHLRIDDGTGPLDWTAATSKNHVEWAPSSPGHVDAGSVTRLEKLSFHGSGAKAPSSTFDSATVTIQSADADPDRSAAFVHRLWLFVEDMPVKGKGQKADLTPAQRTELHALLHMARDLVGDTKFGFEADGMAAGAQGHGFGIDKLAMTQKLSQPGGKIDFAQRIEVTGLHVADLPPGPMRALLPHHVVLAPHFSGIAADDLFGMLDKMIDDPDASPADAMAAAVAKSPVTAGLDELAFDVGPATLAAHGSVAGTGSQDVDGTASVEATGLDALVKQAGADPMLKQGVPVLIFLKGIGEQQGDKVVWNLAYKDGSFTVNGTDMSSLIPGK